MRRRGDRAKMVTESLPRDGGALIRHIEGDPLHAALANAFKVIRPIWMAKISAKLKKMLTRFRRVR
jgi:hypothetical protein